MKEAIKKRNSSVELLKIIAIILIITNHVVQSLVEPSTFLSVNDYLLDITKATVDPQLLILVFLRSFGTIGNLLFFICSSWFLLESKTIKIKKIANIFLNVILISLIILGIVLLIRKGNIDSITIVKQFFPITFNNNWYITCYLLFYSIHPLINAAIERLDKKTHFYYAIVGGFLYLGIDYLIGQSHYYASTLVVWIVIYFSIAFVKKYYRDFFESRTKGLIMFAIGLLGHLLVIGANNFLGLKIDLFSKTMLHWNTSCSPFLVLEAVGLFVIFKTFNISSKVVNYISSTSLLIYLFHENFLLRSYYRPFLWKYVYNNFGYNYLFAWLLLFIVAIFLVSFLISVIYKHSIQRLVAIMIESIYKRGAK